MDPLGGLGREHSIESNYGLPFQLPSFGDLSSFEGLNWGYIGLYRVVQGYYPNNGESNGKEHVQSNGHSKP